MFETPALRLFEQEETRAEKLDLSLDSPVEDAPVKQEPVKMPNADELFGAWRKAPDPKNFGKLLTAVNPYVENSVKYYTGKSDPVAVSYGRRLAAEALQKYDPERGTSIQTYLTRQLQPIVRWNAKRSIAVHIPERMVAEYGSIRKAEEELYAELGRPPSTEEVADFTGIPTRRIAKVRAASPVIMAGSHVIKEDDEDVVTAEDLPVEVDKSMEWAQYVRQGLSDVDKVIVDHTLGLNGLPVMSNTKLAGKLGITAAAVSQRKAKIQAILDRQSELSPFK